MNLVRAHYRAIMLDLVRAPAYSILTLLIPGVIFLFVSPGGDGDIATANVIMASFVMFMILGIALFQGGVAIAQERESPWEAYQRTLPVSTATRFTAHVLATMSFALVGVAFVIVLALATTPAAMPTVLWARLGLSVVVAGVVMSLFGIALGYSASSRAAMPIANFVFIGLALGGGLFLRPEQLPDFIQPVSRVLPTRQFGELAWSAVLGCDWPVTSWLWVVGYFVVFAAAATYAYGRDEGVKYR